MLSTHVPDGAKKTGLTNSSDLFHVSLIQLDFVQPAPFEFVGVELQFAEQEGLYGFIVDP